MKYIKVKDIHGNTHLINAYNIIGFNTVAGEDRTEIRLITHSIKTNIPVTEFEGVIEYEEGDVYSFKQGTFVKND